MSRYKRWAFIIVALLLAMLLGCQREPVDKVTVQLKWVHQAQFAGFYVAQSQGYYTEENLDVTLLEGGPDVDIIEQLRKGNADFVIYTAEDIIVERSEGTPIVALAAIYRRNPMMFVSLAESGIQRPADLIGKTVALAPDGEIQFHAMMQKLGLDIDDVTLAPYDRSYANLYDGEVDVTEAYAIGGLIRMQEAGYDVNAIWPDDYGIHLYSDVLATSETMITDQPEVVERFLRATLRGWRTAIGNPETGLDATLHYAGDSDPAIQEQMLENSAPLIHTGTAEIGWMEPEVWQQTQEILLDYGTLDQPIAIASAYTLKFLQEIYGTAP